MRNLTRAEIDSLLANNCNAQDWTQVFVRSKDFSTNYISNVTFSGKVVLGRLKNEFTINGGLVRHSCIRNAILHNCEIGNDVLIENIANHISNYIIGDNCYIQNVNTIACENLSSFGNGVYVSVLNETGGREVPIYNGLSSSIAYIIAMYRHNKEFTKKFYGMIEEYAKSISSEFGRIGKGVKILNTGTIKHVNIGDYAKIINCVRLENGSVNSNIHAPVYVGDGVMATNFIFSSGSYLSDSAKIINCFIGQSCKISHNFSAHDTLAFANCNFENGEACAIFAGPFTVTVHKSSLLIAGMYSFLNAGSGSNQSNHMYKLGPIHQGIVERGSKTTSDSYILWPAKIGAFSLVMGRHYHHADTSNLPFSYLIEKSDETFLVPGVNLRSVGTIRDVQKWPKRDNRKDIELLDCINYNLLSPFTVRKMIKGRKILLELREVSGMIVDVYSYRGTRIKNSSLRTGISLYEKALNKFFGNSLITRLQSFDFNNIDELRKGLKPTHKSGLGNWVDLQGLIAPKSDVDKLLTSIESSKLSLSKLSSKLNKLHKDYYDMEWTWAYNEMESYFGINFSKITVEEIIKIIEVWLDSVISIDNMLYNDAQKEFNMTSMVGFGMDGSEEDKEKDFESVRGDFDNNTFVTSIQKHIVNKTELANSTLAKLKKI